MKTSFNLSFEEYEPPKISNLSLDIATAA